jgi:hypothetical protein
LLLGLDGAGIAAVCSLAEQGSAALVKIRAIAVDVRHRGQGGAVQNEASKRMNTRAGFGFQGPTSDGLEQWILVLDL